MEGPSTFFTWLCCSLLATAPTTSILRQIAYLRSIGFRDVEIHTKMGSIGVIYEDKLFSTQYNASSSSKITRQTRLQACFNITGIDKNGLPYPLVLAFLSTLNLQAVAKSD